MSISAKWPGKCKDCGTPHKQGDQISSNKNDNWCSKGDQCPACYKTTGPEPRPEPTPGTKPTPEQAITIRTLEDSGKLIAMEKRIESLKKLYGISDAQIELIKTNIGMVLITDQLTRIGLFPTDKDPRGDHVGMITKISLSLSDD